MKEYRVTALGAPSSNGSITFVVFKEAFLYAIEHYRRGGWCIWERSVEPWCLRVEAAKLSEEDMLDIED